MTTTTPVVYIVDDDADMRDSLVYLMQSVGLVTEAYASPHDFFQAYRRSGPACLVCDVRMPEVSGLELYERLVAEGAALPVIFMTAYADVPMAIRAMKSGAIEFVEKPFHAQTLLERVQLALSEDRRRWDEKLRFDDLELRMGLLTDKEQEALSLIMDGSPNKAIAARFDITERAVEMRRASIMKKLQVHSLAELIRLVTEFRLLSENRTRRRPTAGG
ncbi:MAG TPA: response regulator [Planctomycetaceae bacterium]|nr:response regulator [Planctomycetaceae bacterium]